MSNERKLISYKTLNGLVKKFRRELKNTDSVLLFAYNGTGKTRLSVEFKEAGKRKRNIERDTLYFNAYTEDLFTWENDLQSNSERYLRINQESQFFSGFKELALEEKIYEYFGKYTDLDFRIDYDKWSIAFSRNIIHEVRDKDKIQTENIKIENIKISRGEENIFIWCIFLALCELVIEDSEAYDWVEYIYIDDPISSLDDNNAIAVATDLSDMLRRGKNKFKTVISTHHGLFFNILCNELKSSKKYFLTIKHNPDLYSLRSTNDTPFFYHVSIINKLKKARDTGNLFTYHFNMLRSILEKTASFFGFEHFSSCLKEMDDEIIYQRALHLLSHGKYSIYEPVEMVPDTKKLFEEVFDGFIEKYEFNIIEQEIKRKK